MFLLFLSVPAASPVRSEDDFSCDMLRVRPPDRKGRLGIPLTGPY